MEIHECTIDQVTLTYFDKEDNTTDVVLNIKQILAIFETVEHQYYFSDVNGEAIETSWYITIDEFLEKINDYEDAIEGYLIEKNLV